MWRKSSNNPWIPPQGINSGSFAYIGGQDISNVSRFAGQLGAIWVANNADALKASYPTNGTMYEGVYQLVKYSSGVTTVAKGGLLFWDTLANNGQNDFEVTPTVAATAGFKAGVALAAETAGGSKYVWIQIAGMAQCLYRAAVTSAVIGNIVVQTSLTTNTVDAIADATDYFTTMGAFKTLVGIAYATPANDGYLRVWLNEAGFYRNASS